jgi:hypothetical protein
MKIKSHLPTFYSIVITSLFIFFIVTGMYRIPVLFLPYTGIRLIQKPETGYLNIQQHIIRLLPYRI